MCEYITQAPVAMVFSVVFHMLLTRRRASICLWILLYDMILMLPYGKTISRSVKYIFFLYGRWVELRFLINTICSNEVMLMLLHVTIVQERDYKYKTKLKEGTPYCNNVFLFLKKN